MSASVAERLARVSARIEEACRISGRRPQDVTLVAVSKRQPLERLRSAMEAGQHVFGENQLQEAERKIAQLPQLSWHMIGPLQSNKARRAARLFDAVHSLDRLKIARLLNAEATALGKRLDVFVQINIGAEASKHGFAADRLEEDVRPLVDLPGLRIVGLMAIPPFEEEAEKARHWLQKMRQLRDEMATWSDWAEFPGWLSMGMSRDLEIAIAEGATHVRVGTDVFGPRPS